MAISNTKNNWIRRVLGKDNTSRNQQEPQQEMPTQEAQPQEQQQPQATTSRYKMYELMQSKPERDVEQEEIIKRRAKLKALSSGFSGLAGLAGMAVGGDAPEPTDSVTPWNMNMLQNLDQDYRSRLQDWMNKGYQVDQDNTGLINKELQEDFDWENKQAAADQKFERDQQLLNQRAENALKQLQMKSQAEQVKDMQAMGIDPNSKDAYARYLQAKKDQFSANMGLTKARTNWNNRLASSSGSRGGSGTPQKEFDIPTLQRGKQRMLKEIQEQRKGLDSFRDKAQIEALNAQEKQIREYNPGKNELIDAEVYQYGIMEDESPQAQSQRPSGPSIQYQEGRGFTNVPKANDPVIKARLSKGFQKAFEGTLDENTLLQMMQDLVDTGEAEDEDEAYQIIENYIQENNQ